MHFVCARMYHWVTQVKSLDSLKWTLNMRSEMKINANDVICDVGDIICDVICDDLQMTYNVIFDIITSGYDVTLCMWHHMWRLADDIQRHMWHHNIRTSYVMTQQATLWHHIWCHTWHGMWRHNIRSMTSHGMWRHTLWRHMWRHNMHGYDVTYHGRFVTTLWRHSKTYDVIGWSTYQMHHQIYQALHLTWQKKSTKNISNFGMYIPKTLVILGYISPKP